MKDQMAFSKKIVLSLFFSLLLQGCHTPGLFLKISKLFSGTASEVSQGAPTPIPTPDDSLSLLPDLGSSPTPAAVTPPPVKPNADLLTEMFQVVFQKPEIEDKPLFTSLVSSLNQGASLEGIYNGLVLGATYRGMESKGSAAIPAAIKFFVAELSELQVGMKSPTLYNKDMPKLVPTISYPAGMHPKAAGLPKPKDESIPSAAKTEAIGGDGPDSLSFGETPKPTVKLAPSPTPTPEVSVGQSSNSEQALVKKTQRENADELFEVFIVATPLTLKRVLCDEVMKKIDEMKDSPDMLAQWYAGFAVRMVPNNIDFGLPLRNSGDFDLQLSFAKTKSIDQLKWEVVNRYQRVLNKLNQVN